MFIVGIITEPAFWIGVIATLSTLVFLSSKLGLVAHRLTERPTLKAVCDEKAILELIVQHANDGIVVQDVFGRIEWSNPAYSRISGFDADEIRGRRPQEFILPDDEKPSEEEIASFRYCVSSGILDSYEIVRNVRKSGEEFWNQLSFAVVDISEDAEPKVIVICRDVTEQIEREEALKLAKQDIEHLAWHDVLTGLANRTQLAAFLEEHLKKGNFKVGLLHVDLDRFKEVNDTLGHAAGDVVLVRTGKIMRSLVRDEDLVSRVGGDEFVIACPGIRSRLILEGMAERIAAALREPFAWQDRPIDVGASIGISLSETDNCDADELMLQADIALYRAKADGRGGFVSFDAGLGREYRHGQQLHAELVAAIQQDQLIVVFQPQLDSSDGLVLGFEALIRWMHPERGLLEPAAFFDMAEESSLMPEIDRIAARGALDGLETLHAAGWPNLRVSINVSSKLLGENDFVETLLQDVKAHRLQPDQVVVEILETTLFSRTNDATAQSIQGLYDAGFVVELDDFGTGYAGLSHLAQLPIHGVKIDCSMIRGLPDNATSQSIVCAIIDLCHKLGLQTVAEGVEYEEQQAFLLQAGCSAVQGYGIARPMQLAETIRWMSKKSSHECKTPMLLKTSSNIAARRIAEPLMKLPTQTSSTVTF